MNLLWQPVGGPKGWHHYCVFPCVIIGVERLLLMRDAIYFNRFSSIVFLPSPLMRKYCKMDQRVGCFCLSLKQQPQSHQWSLKGISQWARQWMESGSMGKKEEKELVPPPWQDRWSWGDQRHRGRQRSRRRIPTWRWWQWACWLLHLAELVQGLLHGVHGVECEEVKISRATHCLASPSQPWKDFLLVW